MISPTTPADAQMSARNSGEQRDINGAIGERILEPGRERSEERLDQVVDFDESGGSLD